MALKNLVPLLYWRILWDLTDFVVLYYFQLAIGCLKTPWFRPCPCPIFGQGMRVQASFQTLSNQLAKKTRRSRRSRRPWRIAEYSRFYAASAVLKNGFRPQNPSEPEIFFKNNLCTWQKSHALNPDLAPAIRIKYLTGQKVDSGSKMPGILPIPGISVRNDRVPVCLVHSTWP